MTASHVRVAEDVAPPPPPPAGETINVTGTVVVHQVAHFNVMAAVRVPAVSPLALTVAVSFLLVVMEVVAGDSESQDALSEAVKVTVSVPGLETVIVWFGRVVAPCTAL